MNLLNEINWEDSGRLDALLPAIEPAVSSILQNALNGTELDHQDGLTLARTSGQELEALVLTADSVRRQRVGDVVTYS